MPTWGEAGSRLEYKVEFGDADYWYPGMPIEPEEAQEPLALAADLRERIRAWREAHGIEPGDVVADLAQLRAERDDQLSGVR